MPGPARVSGRFMLGVLVEDQWMLGRLMPVGDQGGRARTGAGRSAGTRARCTGRGPAELGAPVQFARPSGIAGGVLLREYSPLIVTFRNRRHLPAHSVDITRDVH